MKQEMVFDRLLTSDPATFVQAGSAYFTIKSVVTEQRFTFKVFQKTEIKYDPEKQKDVKVPIDLYFVSLFTGTDNTDWTHYTYMGIIEKGAFRTTAKTKISDDARSMQAFVWFWRNVNNLPDTVKVYWATVCGKCARFLTVDKSITCGYGPDCAAQLDIPYN